MVANVADVADVDMLVTNDKFWVNESKITHTHCTFGLLIFVDTLSIHLFRCLS